MTMPASFAEIVKKVQAAAGLTAANGLSVRSRPPAEVSAATPGRGRPAGGPLLCSRRDA